MQSKNKALPGPVSGSLFLYFLQCKILTKEVIIVKMKKNCTKESYMMAIITIVKTIKSIHPDSVILVKVGKFYNIYGKDSYIMSYLFGYKLKEIEGVYTCGFPVESINKIMAKLENKKVNYLMVDRRNNYDVDGELDNKNLNTYYKTYEKAKEYINAKNRVNNIYEYLLKNLNNKKVIMQIEKVIEDERRKV